MVDVDISQCKDDHDVHQAAMGAVASHYEPIVPATHPIIGLTYKGEASFSTLQINNQRIKKDVMQRTGACECVIVDGSDIVSTVNGTIFLPNRNDIEREEIGKLLDEYPDALKDKALMVSLVRSFKTNALTGAQPRDMIEQIRNAILSSEGQP